MKNPPMCVQRIGSPDKYPAWRTLQRIAKRVVAALAIGLASACGAAPRPDIVLITLDTTRADRLGCYGYRGATTPNLDRLAEEAVVHTRAYSTTIWTFPAHASLFTGKFTTSHGARYDPDGPLRLTSVVSGPERWGKFRVRGLGQGERTLAATLSEAGYSTGAVVAGPWLKRIMGLDRGFEHFDDDGITSMNGRPAPQVTDRALAWVAENRDRPLFLFLNYFDPHQPLTAPPQFIRDLPSEGESSPPRDERSQLYDAEVRFMDHHLGRLFHGLRDLDRYERSWIIVTADHGELLGEHGLIGHGNTLYEELIRVPLIVKYPGREAPTETDDSEVQLIDVFATILDHLGLGIPPDVQGSPLRDVRHPVIAEFFPLESMGRSLRKSTKEWRGDIRTIHQGNYKFVWSSLGRHQLFDLLIDPGESKNLAGELTDVAASMQAELRDYLATLPEPAPDGDERRVDPETEEALRNLGYLE
jgi:arylsulfatase A-like enzyme